MHKLQILNLNGHELGTVKPYGWSELLNALNHTPDLRILSLQCNAIDEDAIQNLIESYNSNITLKF